jgi:protein TonB
MELKKSPKADLENKRSIFFELGLAIAIAACLFSFKSFNRVNQAKTLGTLEGKNLVEELPPITRPEDINREIPKLPKLADLILIADNLAEIDEDPLFDDTGADANTAIYALPQAEGKKEKEVVEEPFVYFAEEMPEFPGGEKALLKFLSQSIKYPSIAAETGVNGKVIVNFIVNTDGTICGVKLLRSVDQSLDKEALRVVSSMPRWKPGKQSGKLVRVSYSVPINFMLQ